MNRIYPTVLLISILAFPAISQEPDSVRVYQPSDSARVFQPSDTAHVFQPSDTLAKYIVDSLEIYQPDYSHSSSKALMYALVLPGLGQAYNKKYYKMPIVWAALGAVGYAIGYNTKQYRQASLDYAKEQSETTEFYLQAWRRNMELSYIGLIVTYALQMVDAYVDAQLYNWDVSDNLSLRIAPSLQPLLAPTSLTGQSYGLTCSFNLKGR